MQRFRDAIADDPKLLSVFEKVVAGETSTGEISLGRLAFHFPK